jgi:transcription elongation factor Elf1
MEIRIKLDMPMPSKEETKKRIPTLEERIEYAIDCIACGHSKKEAILFLQKLYSKMDAVKRQDRPFQDLKNKVATAIDDYGHYHIEDERGTEIPGEDL